MQSTPIIGINLSNQWYLLNRNKFMELRDEEIVQFHMDDGGYSVHTYYSYRHNSVLAAKEGIYITFFIAGLLSVRLSAVRLGHESFIF